ncbi:carph-isopro domain-containing protein [Novosphingobium sp. KA1]|uniref:carph-isopro domain-containing protein n=1 Tax=Novosphingobium sp. (strain KA1) TaxID=164608 RepID=UPI001A8D4DE1|nr:hypothetical protein [Novosphingobium sp. KA1]
MKQGETLFSLWGVRQMARDIERPAGTVHGWKKKGRIPSEEQPHVLAVAARLGLPITAEHVVFPLGRHAADVAAPADAVVCDPTAKAQRTDGAE